jgi:esterase/lipase
MSTSSKLKVALLVGAIAAVVAFMLKVVLGASPDELEVHTDDPAPDYETAMKWFEQVNAQEAAMEGLNPVCLSTVLTHGKKTERVIVLMHGMTNCPAQFRTLAPMFFERGYNVLIPRMPGNGLADPDTKALKEVTAEQLRDCCTDMVDLAHGLGEHVTYLGLSIGGTMAAWAAQNRADVDLAVLMAPEFTIGRGLGVAVSKLVMYVFRIMPNLMTQRVRPFTGAVGHNYHGFATRGLAQSMRLGFSVFDAAKSRKPVAQSILVITNAADPAVNNTITQKLVQLWQANGMQRLDTYEFNAKHHLIHDVIDPNQQEQQTALVYPILLDLIAQE